jgi:hypothetical protein
VPLSFLDYGRRRPVVQGQRKTQLNGNSQPRSGSWRLIWAIRNMVLRPDRCILDGVIAREAATPRERYKRRAPLHRLNIIPGAAFE